jgi:hypothetical protein
MDDVQALQRLMEAGFEALKERLDDDRTVQTQRHNENVGRLASIEREVRHTNGRVTRNEEQIKSLFRRTERKPEEEEEQKFISRLDFRYLILSFVAGALVLAWLLHLIGKL